MKILYDDQGEIIHVVTEADWPTFSHSSHVNLTLATIPDNDETLRQTRAFLYNNYHKRDDKGQGPCYVDTKAGTLVIREDWVEQEI